jgi:hypothetical protein
VTLSIGGGLGAYFIEIGTNALRAWVRDWNYEFGRAWRGSKHDGGSTSHNIALSFRSANRVKGVNYSGHAVPMDIANKIETEVAGTLIRKNRGIKRETRDSYFT